MDDQGEHQGEIAEDRSPREGGDDRRDHPRSGDEDHVDFGMTKKPEQVLPQ